MRGAQKAQRGRRCIAPLILDLGTRWMWVVNYLPQALYPPSARTSVRAELAPEFVRTSEETTTFQSTCFVPIQAKQTDVNAAVIILLTLRQTAAAWQQLIKLPHSANDSYKQRCSNIESGGGPTAYFSNMFFVTAHTQRPRCFIAADATREAMYVKHNMEARSCNHFCSGKAVSHDLSVYL